AKPPGTITASTPPIESSPCHSSSASPPRERTASMASCSQFEPGKRMTPTFMIRSSGRQQRDVGVLDDRVGQELLAHLGDLGPGGALVGRLAREPDGLAHR